MKRAKLKDPMTAACAALGRRAWEEARDGFAAASARDGAPDLAEAFEGLGLAQWWLENEAAAIDAREQAYRLFDARGDRHGAARVATWLASDYLPFPGERALADDWRGRAHRLIDDLPMAPEHGWLAHCDGEIALHCDDDPTAARLLGAKAAEVGRALAIDDLETAGMALEGLALVMAGDVGEGIRRLDKVADAAFSGEMGDYSALDATLRHLIGACEALRDVARTADGRIEECTARWRAATLIAPRRARPPILPRLGQGTGSDDG